MKDDFLRTEDDEQLNSVLDNDNKVACDKACDAECECDFEKNTDGMEKAEEFSLDTVSECVDAEVDEESMAKTDEIGAKEASAVESVLANVENLETEQVDEATLKKKKIKRRILNAIWVSVIAVLLALVVFVNVFQLCLVVGSSMEYTLQNGEFLLMQRICLDIDRGDIVTLQVKDQDKYPIIKRVVAIKGDRVVFMYDDDDNVLLYIDKGKGFELQQEEYVKDGKMSYSAFDTFDQFNDGKYRVSPKCELDQIHESCIIEVDGLFVLGDNRDNSYDSRHYGIIPYENVQSKVVKELKKGSFAEKILKIIFNA